MATTNKPSVTLDKARRNLRKAIAKEEGAVAIMEAVDVLIRAHLWKGTHRA